MSRLDEIKANKQKIKPVVPRRWGLKLVSIVLLGIGLILLIKVYFLQNKSIQELIQQSPGLAENGFVQLFTIDTSISLPPAVWGENIADEHEMPPLHVWIEAKAVNNVNVIAVAGGEAQLYAQLPVSGQNSKIYSDGSLLFVSGGEVWSWSKHKINKQFDLEGATAFYFSATNKNLYYITGQHRLAVLKPNGANVDIMQNVSFIGSTFIDVNESSSMIYLENQEGCFSINLHSKLISSVICDEVRPGQSGVNPVVSIDPPGELKAETKGILKLYDKRISKYQDIASVPGYTFSMPYLAQTKLAALQSEVIISPLGLASTALDQVVVYNTADGSLVLATEDLPPGSEIKDLSLDPEGKVYLLVEELGEEYEQLWQFDTTEEEWSQVTIPGCELGCDLAFIE